MAEILGRYLAEMASRGFTYGIDDCATFVLGWLDIAHGKTALCEWRGRYNDEASCEAFIAENGGFTAIASAFFAEHYGFGTAPPRRGNVVFADFKGNQLMGIRVDEKRVALRSRTSLGIVSRAKVLAEWGPA